MILLITGRIVAENGSKKISINSNKRKDQYIISIKRAIKQLSKINEISNSVNENRIPRKASIVYCDNSNPESIIFEEVIQYAKSKHIKMEVISYDGESCDGESYNDKAYNIEDEVYDNDERIVDYAISHSELIADDDYIMKLSGKYSLDNMVHILRYAKTSLCYINVLEGSRKTECDTRFFGMNKDTYKKHFYGRKQAQYISIIKEARIKTDNLPLYPLYREMVGSGECLYNRSNVNMKYLLSKLHYYRI